MASLLKSSCAISRNVCSKSAISSNFKLARQSQHFYSTPSTSSITSNPSSTSNPPPSIPSTTTPSPSPPKSYSLDSPITLHAPPHGYHVATLHLRSYGPFLHLLDFFSYFALRVASSLNIPTSGVASLPTRISLWTVPKGPFVHKKSQENFQRRTHKRVIKVWDADQKVLDRWLTFLRIHAMEGVGMRVELFSYHPVDYSEKMVEQAQSQRRSSPAINLTSSSTTKDQESKSESPSTSTTTASEQNQEVSSSEKVKELAEGIIRDEMKDLGKDQ